MQAGVSSTAGPAAAACGVYSVIGGADSDVDC